MDHDSMFDSSHAAVGQDISPSWLRLQSYFRCGATASPVRPCDQLSRTVTCVLLPSQQKQVQRT
jgi:hypothetical protein